MFAPRVVTTALPFVLGTPSTLGSIATACRSARATALNAASMMWWLFSPANDRTCSVMAALAASAMRNSLASVVSNVPTISMGSSTS